MSDFSVRVCRLEDYPEFLVECRKDLSVEVGIPFDSPYNRMNPGEDVTNILGSYCFFCIMFDGEKPVCMTETFLYRQKYTRYDECSIQDMLSKHSDPAVDLRTYCDIGDMAHIRSVATIEEYRSKTVVFPGTLYMTIKVLDMLGIRYATGMGRLSLLDMYSRLGFQVISKVDVTTAMKIRANDASFIILSVKDWLQGRLCGYVEKRMKFKSDIDEKIVREITARKSLL